MKKKILLLAICGTSFTNAFAGWFGSSDQRPPVNLNQEWNIKVAVACKSGDSLGKISLQKNNMETISIKTSVSGFDPSPIIDLLYGLNDIESRVAVNGDGSIGVRANAADTFAIIGDLDKQSLAEGIQEVCGQTSKEYFEKMCRENWDDYNLCMDSMKKYYTEETTKGAVVRMIPRADVKINYKRSAPECVGIWGPFDSTRKWQTIYTVSFLTANRSIDFSKIGSSTQFADKRDCKSFNDGWTPAR